MTAKPLGVPYLPSEFAKNHAQFCTMLKATPPTSAKLIDTDGGLLVTTATRRIYWRLTANSLRVLHHYGVKL